MPKGLRLKRTRAEEAERDLRRARKAAKKAALRQRSAQDVEDGDLDHVFPDPGPSTSRRGTCAAGTAEDDTFREKLWDALGDDDRLDAVEAQLNEYAHVPRRWRGASSQVHDPDSMAGPDDDPRLMDDDEYAEWVRVGMWRCVPSLATERVSRAENVYGHRRRNAAAHHEQQRQKAAQAAAQAEAAQTLKAKEAARRREHEERERRRQAAARDTYEWRWVELLESKSADLGFGDVPWPVRGKADISRLTAEVISAFLFPVCLEEEGLDDGGRARKRREELRGTMLRFHPDKFEGRVIPRVREEERHAVREGANAVARAVTTLMESKY
jgi:hypothetical protein